MAAQLQDFFQSHSAEVDGEVLEYCAALVSDEPDLEDLRETLTGFAPLFGALPLDAQQQQVSNLLRQVQQLEQHTPAPAQHASSAGNVVAETTQMGGPAHSIGNAEDAQAGCAQQQQQEQQQQQQQDRQQQQQAVDSLRDMFALDCLSDAFLAHVLVAKGGGCLQEAAAWMLESQNLPAAQEAWQHALQRELEEQQQEAVAQAQAKKLIVQRYLLQPVPNGGGGDGKGRPPALKAWGAGSSGEAKCKARYREGAVVTSRGEKYIIEKQGEEWDGGSRGKVVSKGKRGKGFY